MHGVTPRCRADTVPRRIPARWGFLVLFAPVCRLGQTCESIYSRTAISLFAMLVLPSVLPSMLPRDRERARTSQDERERSESHVM